MRKALKRASPEGAASVVAALESQTDPPTQDILTVMAGIQQWVAASTLTSPQRRKRVAPLYDVVAAALDDDEQLMVWLLELDIHHAHKMMRRARHSATEPALLRALVLGWMQCVPKKVLYVHEFIWRWILQVSGDELQDREVFALIMLGVPARSVAAAKDLAVWRGRVEIFRAVLQVIPQVRNTKQREGIAELLCSARTPDRWSSFCSVSRPSQARSTGGTSSRSQSSKSQKLALSKMSCFRRTAQASRSAMAISSARP